MSLFIGSDISGDKILHITSGQNTLEEMKSGRLPNTIFHNDMSYILWEEETDFTVSGSSAGFYVNCSSTLANKLRTQSKMWIFLFNGVVYNAGAKQPPYITQPNNGHSGVWFPPYDGYYPSTLPSSTYTRFWVDDGTSPINVKLFTINIQNGNYLPIAKTANGVEIGNGTIIVDGIDLLSGLGTISATKINNVDTTGIIGASTIQFLNSELVAGQSLQLISNPTLTEIRRDNIPIFSTSYSTRLFYKGKLTSSISSITLPTQSIEVTNSATINIPTLVKGGLVYVRVQFDYYQEGYPVGNIIDIFSYCINGQANTFNVFDNKATSQKVRISLTSTTNSQIIVSRIAINNDTTVSFSIGSIAITVLYTE